MRSSVKVHYSVVKADYVGHRTHLDCEDIFAHFEKMQAEKRVPTLQELREHAREVHQRFSTQEAWSRAMAGGEIAAGAGWRLGTAWVPPQHSAEPPVIGRVVVSEENQGETEEDSEEVAPDHGDVISEARDEASDHDESEDSHSSDGSHSDSSSTSSSTKSSPNDESRTAQPAVTSSNQGSPPGAAPFTGDRTLAQSILFMRDAMISREVAQAVSCGDVGRVWNAFKVRELRPDLRRHAPMTESSIADDGVYVRRFRTFQVHHLLVGDDLHRGTRVEPRTP